MNKPQLISKADFLKSIDICSKPLVSLAALARSCLSSEKKTDRPLIIRPGGMGDLIVLMIAIENLGLDPKSFDWIIEKRSEIWAQYSGLNYFCYDRDFIDCHFRNIGSYSTVINTEQLFGLSQLTAVINAKNKKSLTCYSTNRNSSFAGNIVEYNSYKSHEAVEFQKIIIAALGLNIAEPGLPVRTRIQTAENTVIIGISGTITETRAFSPQWWAKQALKIPADKYLICSSPSEKAFALQVKSLLPNADYFEAGFSKMCDQLKTAKYVFTVDGGFAHIASYLGVPSYVVFTSGIKEKWLCLAEGSKAISRLDLGCQPCTHFGQVPKCNYGFACKNIEL